MTDKQTTTAMVPLKGEIVNNSAKRLAVRRWKDYMGEDVPHLDIERVRRVIEAATNERDQLLIKTLFDGCFRVSEAIGIRPRDIIQDATGWVINIIGKGGLHSTVAVSPSLVAQIQSYAYRYNVPPDTRIFTINRFRVHQIVSRAMADAGVVKPDGVGAVHVLRHSGALERLKLTGNPKAVQEQLRHRDPRMTLRYMKTLSRKEAIEIQKGVDYQW
ncbi:tyrosine-type recombinase/integrase [Chloroflexota bacterium]